MFTGIIEATGTLLEAKPEGSNVHLKMRAPFTHELKVDQSVAHNGICLTVTAIDGDTYSVTAVDETMKRTNLGHLKAGSSINLERCMKIGDRLDGHIVQGHVDGTAVCDAIENFEGSTKFYFAYDTAGGHVTVEKGSICVNGVSLTVVDSEPGKFSVVIIPFTFEHTNFRDLKTGDTVNLEFDIIGKYVAAMMKR